LKLPLGQLTTHLERNLARLYLVAADEPLLVGEATDQIRRAATERGFDERDVHFVERSFRWDSVLAGADSLSLFSEKRILELRMNSPRPGDAGAKAIRELAESDDPDRLVIISIQARLDASAQRSVWVKTCEKLGVVVDIRAVTRESLPGFIGRRARKHGLTIATDAAELLADRVEGNLLAADQELAKLALITESGRVNADDVLAAVASNARFDVFRLSDAVIAGDLPRALRVLAGLQQEGVAPPLVAWALVREILLLSELRQAIGRGMSPEQAMSRQRVWQSRQPALRRALGRYTEADLARFVAAAERVDRAAKGLERRPVWDAITELVIGLLTPRRRSRAA